MLYSQLNKSKLGTSITPTVWEKVRNIRMNHNSLYQSQLLQLNASGYAALANAIAPQLKSLLA